MTTHTTDHQPRTRLAMFGAFVLTAIVLAALALAGAPGSDAQSTSIVINEIQPGNVATLADGDGSFEDWIELRNTTNADIDIAGWRIDDSTGSWTVTVDPLRPERTIVPANGFLLVWASDKGDPLDLGFPGPADELHASFKLSRTTDSVTLTNGFTVVDTLSYGPAEVPAGFDDDESYGLNDAGALVIFTPVDVTPMAPNGEVTVPTPIPIGPASIVINEVMQGNQITLADGDGEFEDWFELYNPTCQSVDLTGWSVRDSAEQWQLPDGLVLAPGELVLLWASNKGDPTNVDQFPGPADELHTNFRLALAGEELLLLDSDGQLIALVNPGPSAVDESYGLDAKPADIFSTERARLTMPPRAWHEPRPRLGRLRYVTNGAWHRGKSIHDEVTPRASYEPPSFVIRSPCDWPSATPGITSALSNGGWPSAGAGGTGPDTRQAM